MTETHIRFEDLDADEEETSAEKLAKAMFSGEEITDDKLTLAKAALFAIKLS